MSMIRTRERKPVFHKSSVGCKGTDWCSNLGNCIAMRTTTSLCPGNVSVPPALYCVLTLLVMSLPVTVSGAAIGDNGNFKTYVHNEITCFKCDPGWFVYRHCTEDFTYSDCDQCPSGTFQSDYSQAEWCEPCRTHCPDENMSVVRSCSATHDMECECKPGYYLHVESEEFEIYACVKYTPCLPGQVVVQEGSSESDQVCGACGEGTFSSGGQCEVCTSCQDLNRTQLVACNSTADTVCGDTQEENETPIEQPVPTGGLENISLVLVPMIVLVFLVPVFILCFIRRKTGTKKIAVLEKKYTLPNNLIYTQIPKHAELSESSQHGAKSAGHAQQHERNVPGRSRIHSDSSCTSVFDTNTLLLFPELTNPALWTADIFQFLSSRLAGNWKQFMANLPGDEKYKSTITARCEQIVMEERDNVPEQIYKALREWERSNDGGYVTVEGIFFSLKKMGHNDIADMVLIKCSKLAQKSRY